MEAGSDEDISMDEDLYCESGPSGRCQRDAELEKFLEELGLNKLYTEKLSLGRILQIEKRTIHDDVAKCQADLPWYFLKKLMMVNVTARNEKCSPESSQKESLGNTFNFDALLIGQNSEDRPNPLDIITVLFLCSDGFVQQEMALKMSLCQFSVPLLLPNCDTNQVTLMLWALRDIVKKYRPQSLSESKGFVEDRIVLSELPLISFVRLGECSLSKSHILNKLLSTPQQNLEAFVHRDMEGGDCPRRISNGLTEITWYLPAGNKNMDVFSEPVAVANLRGDMASFETQYSFLCQTSTAVFVFFDNLDSDCKLLTSQANNAQIFLVGNCQSKNFNVEALEKVASNLNLDNSNILLKTRKMNDADLIKELRKMVSNVVEKPGRKVKITQMVDVAHELGILVDEDATECQTAKKNADAITQEIQDIVKYKEKQLPLQGQIWKELTSIEKEECRLEKVGTKNIETYKSDLQIKKEELRRKQSSRGMSKAMACFITAISQKERLYFLKWMRMVLDNLSQRKLSALRELYKKKCKNSKNKEEIKDIDRQLSNSSLGTEHFFREMGQIYEALSFLPQTDPSRQQVRHLPKLCAQLLLDGFPLELVDGDASNIPLRWVTEVLSQLNDLVAPNNKIMVVTVLGVQSTGKSTLLNTMFGVQFAVSSGRCTRGAFMLLIRVNEDIQKELKCDFVVIIDTEGLKSQELAQLDNSYEHDNELATLVVGLSDVTIINVAMENSTEMKDILQIVVHAFLRMKEVGKKPKCQFVHQNVSDVSAHDKNVRDRNLLLQQLDELTQVAARMEKKENNKGFTDVMEYNPDTGNCYIPGLWNGKPPMAPVSAWCSEAVYELKKNIIQMFGNSESSANNISEFIKWMSSLWNAVKHEDFIFSFRNSLVAEAYIRLSTEFNKWEWDFKQYMYSWVTTAENRIKNFGTAADQSQSRSIQDLLTSLKTDASIKLTAQEEKIQKNLTEYFKQREGHVKLVEKHKEDFKASALSLRRELESSVTNQLTAAAQIKEGMAEVDLIKKNYIKELEKRVYELIEKCQKMTDSELDQKFDEMWKQTEDKLTYSQQTVLDVRNEVYRHLVENLKTQGSHAQKILKGKKTMNFGIGSSKYYFEKKKSIFTSQRHIQAVQTMADSIIAECTQFVSKKVSQKCNYHDTQIQEILRRIDLKLENNKDLKTSIDFDVSLKMHICEHAASEFQRMHVEFIYANDPRNFLNENKDIFRETFKDVFHKRVQEREEKKREEQRAEEERKRREEEEKRREEERAEEERKRREEEQAREEEEKRQEEERRREAEQAREMKRKEEEAEERKRKEEEQAREKKRKEEQAEKERQRREEEEAREKKRREAQAEEERKRREEEKRKEELCRTKAEEFTSRCLRPAVEDVLNNSLGSKIVEEMKGCKQYTTRMFFQHDLLSDLLAKDDLKNYISYTHSYEDYVKKWILDQILTHFSDGQKMSELEDQLIQSCSSSINKAIYEATKNESGDLKTFVDDVCKELGDKLSVSQDALQTFMFLLEADPKHFAEWLRVCVEDMSTDLAATRKETVIQTKLDNLKMKPQDELFSSVIGCGKQCPFCKTPCDLAGKGHQEHAAQLHRPEGLGRYRWDSSQKLVTDICSSLVVSNSRFRCAETKNEWHPYKSYTQIFPDWKIPPDGSLQASDYWKYVMAKFNDDLAREFDAQPADIPQTWKSITLEEAQASLKESFNG